jgi:hypothetical protein
MRAPVDLPRLEKRRDELLRSLRGLGNLMRGSLYTAHVRCGAPNCACTKGLKHETQHLSVKLHGRNRNVYVGAQRAQEVAALIDEYQHAWRLIDELTEINIELLRARGRSAAKERQS